MAAFPTVKVEVAFASDPLDTTPTYTDITAYASAITTKIGREEQFVAYQPGTASVTLDNTDRLFDPLHDTGTYYGNLIPNKRVRLSATWDATEYELFTGHVNGWPQSYDQGEQWVTVNATDAFKLLSRLRMPSDQYALEVLADTPRLWYRFNETAGTKILDSSGNGRDAFGAIDVSNVAADGLMPCSTDGGINLDEAQWDARIPAEHLAFDYDPCTVEFWFRANKPPSGGYVGVICSANEAGLYPEILISYEDPGVSLGGYLSFGINQWLGGYRLVGGAPFICDGLPHHVVCTRSGSTLKVYIDGVDVTAGSLSFGSLTATVGAPLDVNVNYLSGTYEKWEGAQSPALDEFAIYDTALSAADALRHYEAGARLWDGDRTGERIDHILAAVGWPTALASTDTGQNILGPASWAADAKALDLCRIVEATEQGAFYCDHHNDGLVRFRGRSDFLTATRSTTSQGTFSDNDGDAGTVIRYDHLELIYDDTEVINRVDVSWVGGTSTTTDQTSIDAYGEQSRTIETVMPTKADADALASWVLHHYKDVFTRVRSITINPAAQSGTSADLAWAQVLNRQIGDRIKVVRHPQGVGTEIEQELMIEGIEHDISNGVDNWTTTFRCGPAEANSYWILGTSTLGTDTRLAF